MPRLMVLIANAVLPGSMLPWQGAPLRGMILLAGTVISTSVMVIGTFLATPEWWLAALMAVQAYLILAALASLTLWFRARRRPVDREQLKRLHHAAAAAFLRDDASAMTTAMTLVRAAPREAGAWRLLDLIARSAGEPTVAARAVRRATYLESTEG